MLEDLPLFCFGLQGTVFFPLPDGTGLLFNLVGTAEPPKPSGKISRDVPCKTMYIEPLTVHNWLKKPQRLALELSITFNF